jgi:Helix-turn-helix domain
MSNRACTYVWSLDDLSPAAKLVLLKIADCANDEGEAWPSQGTLAARCSLSTRTVRTLLQQLQEQGHLQVIRPPAQHYSAHWRVVGLAPEQSEQPERKSTTPRRPARAEIHDSQTGNPRQPERKSTTPHKGRTINDPKQDPSRTTGDLLAVVDQTQQQAPVDARPLALSATPAGEARPVDGHCSPADIIAIWNAGVTPPVPQVQSLNTDRARKLRALLKRHPTRDPWVRTIAWLDQQPWTHARQRDDGEWHMNFDWLLKAGVFDRFFDEATAAAKHPTRRRNGSSSYTPPDGDWSFLNLPPGTGDPT